MPHRNITISQERENDGHGEFADCLLCWRKKGSQAWVGIILRFLPTDSSAMQNQEAIEVGTAHVPRTALHAARESPIAFFSSKELETSDEKDVLHFMSNEDQALNSTLEEDSSALIKASVKQVSITAVAAGNESNDRLSLWNRVSQIWSALIRKDTPVAVFELETVTMVVNYIWNTGWNGRLIFASVLHFLTTVSFMVFASVFGVGTEGASSSPHLHIARGMISVCLVLTLAVRLNGIYPRTRSLSAISFFEKLKVCVCVEWHRFLSSLHCSCGLCCLIITLK